MIKQARESFKGGLAEMVKYLNKSNKTNLLLLCLMASEAQHIGQALQLEGQLKRKATTISTYAQNLFQEIMDGLDDSQKKQMLRLIRDNTIEVVPTNVFTKRERQDEEDSWVTVLAQKAFESNCIKCRLKDHNACSLKDAMIHMGIDMVNENTDDCPYRVQYDNEGNFIHE